MAEQLFIFTAGSAQAYQHYIDTIENGFTLDSIKGFLTEKMIELLNTIYGNEKIKAWGAVPGPQNIRNWDNMHIGDKILIYRNKNYEYYATISFKLHNKELAKHLWKTNIYVEHEETWEYVYFLKDLTEISVPIKEFNELIGYAENYTPQGFTSISQERIDYIMDKFLSIDGFLNALEEGKWIEKSERFTPEIKREIIREKISKSITKTNLLEQNLENFLAERVEQIEPGLKLKGRQIDTGVVGRLDLLCEDKEGNLVVIELKKMTAGSSIIDQIQRYMGWAMEHQAKESQKVRGIIIVGKKDTYLEYSAKANPNIQVKVFTISFQS